MYKCRHCGKEFTDYPHMNGHITAKHFVGIRPSVLRKLKRIEEYNKNPKLCLECNKPIEYPSKNRFCSHSCAGIFNSRRKERNLRYCLYCREVLPQGSKKRKFCNNNCSIEYKRKTNLENWLKTGIPGKHTGGKSGACPKSGFIKNHILKEQKNKCAMCGLDQIWNNKSLVFVMDHIDGCSINNSRENLRFICPNCDSQTSTYKSRNKGKGRRSLGFYANSGL